MSKKEIVFKLQEVVEKMPLAWLQTTTHRLDIYEEKQAKTQFLEQFETLLKEDLSTSKLDSLPTAYDYIRLGHPLSCVLEWGIASLLNVNANNVISFSSKTIPILAILRTNLLANKPTRILYLNSLPDFFDVEVLQQVYGYKFEIELVAQQDSISSFDGTTIYLSQEGDFSNIHLHQSVDFHIVIQAEIGSVLIVQGAKNESYISDIQHVRRRETIAMTPINCLKALKSLSNNSPESTPSNLPADTTQVLNAIKEITGTSTQPLVASSGLSVQYAILMGLIDYALKNHVGKPIKIVVPPNCYGGTNDQARRVAACLNNVEVVDLPVDGGNNMVQSIELVLHEIAKQNAIALIIAEIPTNPRVEVPNLEQLRDVLQKVRLTPSGETATDPVFILDQTFCPNVHFLGEKDILAGIQTISFASGSKFPSGGLCTSGYCVSNNKAAILMDKIASHLRLCDNIATPQQFEILAKQMPSMNQRIEEAYQHTRSFVNFIQANLPEAKINFVSEALAEQGFTPSVFSLDLPTKGNTPEEKEQYKRSLNHQLINLMISKIPNESKHCVSYGQLKGCYWTIPATSTQGTTKEGDKDYIARVSLSPTMDLEKHKEVFLEFVASI